MAEKLGLDQLEALLEHMEPAEIRKVHGDAVSTAGEAMLAAFEQMDQDLKALKSATPEAPPVQQTGGVVLRPVTPLEAPRPARWWRLQFALPMAAMLLLVVLLGANLLRDTPDRAEPHGVDDLPTKPALRPAEDESDNATGVRYVPPVNAVKKERVGGTSLEAQRESESVPQRQNGQPSYEETTSTMPKKKSVEQTDRRLPAQAAPSEERRDRELYAANEVADTDLEEDAGLLRDRADSFKEDFLSKQKEKPSEPNRALSTSLGEPGARADVTGELDQNSPAVPEASPSKAPKVLQQWLARYNGKNSDSRKKQIMAPLFAPDARNDWSGQPRPFMLAHAPGPDDQWWLRGIEEGGGVVFALVSLDRQGRCVALIRHR